MDLDDEELKATRMMNGADRNSRVRVNNDIEVNEYVRTKNKGIRKIDRIDNNKTINKYLYLTGKEDFEGKEYGIIKTTDIVKHSKQLIDLIEIGDIVNGMEVLDIHKPRDLWEPIEIRVDSRYTNFILAEDIKTILTKESYMANCYKAGGE